MKKILLSGLITMFYSLYAYSQADGLLISENFPYNNGNLSGQGNSPAWSPSGSGNDVVVTSLSNNTGALVYPGYSSGTSFITTDNGNTMDPFKGFIGSQTVSTANATSFYMSFVVRVSNSSNSSFSSFASPSVALRTSSGANVCYFYVADDGLLGTQHLKFGISKTGVFGSGSYASANFSYNTTYLVVIRYDIVTGGTTNDKMYMWINPSLASEPAIASANQSITSGSDGSATGNITGLQLLEDNFFDGTTASFDAFKIAYARGFTGLPSNPNVAWTDLSPAGASLPVKFGDINASQQANGIRLDWTSYNESSTDYYQVERSSDGNSFSAIGKVDASGNSDSKLSYTWLDASPNSGNNFYRVKSVDFDGYLTYSSIIRINTGVNTKGSINIYPNPVRGKQLTLQLNNLQKGIFSVQVFNRMGQQVSQSQLDISEENMTHTLQLPSAIDPGTYNLVISNGTLRLSKTFIIE